MRNALRALDLRDDLCPAAVVCQDFAHITNILRRSREGSRDKIKSHFAAKNQIAAVRIADEGHGQIRARHIDALVIGDRAAVLHRADDFLRSDMIDAEADETVVDQNRRARLHIVDQSLVGDRRPLIVSQHFLCSQRELLTLLQLCAAVPEIAQTYLRSLRIQHRGDRQIQLLPQMNQTLKFGPVLVMRPVREIEPGDVHAGQHQFAHFLPALTGRPDRTDDFRFPHIYFTFSFLYFSSFLLRCFPFPGQCRLSSDYTPGQLVHTIYANLPWLPPGNSSSASSFAHPTIPSRHARPSA